MKYSFFLLVACCLALVVTASAANYKARPQTRQINPVYEEATEEDGDGYAMQGTEDEDDNDEYAAPVATPYRKKKTTYPAKKVNKYKYAKAATPAYEEEEEGYEEEQQESYPVKPKQNKYKASRQKTPAVVIDIIAYEPSKKTKYY